MRSKHSPARPKSWLPLLPIVAAAPALANDTVAVDTGQILTYDDQDVIAPPAPGAPFHGQDAQYDGHQPSYTLSPSGLTVYDQVTGLTWVASPDTDGDGVLESPEDKLSWWDAMSHPATLNAQAFGGYSDWRVPSIEELYSLIDFSGVDPSGYTGGSSGLVPFIDTDYFEFEYGDTSAGERIIDSQYWSSTEYVSTTMHGDHTVFGVNFADGRIKGYGTSLHGNDKVSFVLCCRGNPAYGQNSFSDNGDGTVTDAATGLMWVQGDSGSGKDWEEALSYAENLVYAGHDDWRLPNAKELQGILDYTRSPATHGTPAIDPIFDCTPITDEGGSQNYPFYWASTTHANWTANPGSFGVYVCFGEALGWMQDPFPPFNYTLLDVHGAGSQRSDPKAGDPADWPYGNGPQGDVVRIYNFVRCVRDVPTCPPPTNYCVGAPNSVGSGGVMSYSGSTSVAQNDLVLEASSLPPLEYSMFIRGENQTQVPLFEGYLCVDPPFIRLLPVVTIGIDGTASHAFDSTQAGIVAGETWNFQLFYRDPAGGGTRANLTDGLEVTFCP